MKADWRRAAFAVAIASAAAGSAPSSFAQTTSPPPKWGPHIDFEGKAGNKRNIGEADVFVPLWQNDTTLVFGNVRTRLDDDDSREGNFGVGVRHMLPSGWNIGGYGYFDRRRTENDNYFNQVTLGVEALSWDWDFRANAYIAEGRRTHELSRTGGDSTASVSGTTVQVATSATLMTEERSLQGFDAEIGWRVPLFDLDAGQQLRIYGGAYRFYADDVDPVQGPRARAELTFDEVPYLWEGSRLTLGAEAQHDDPRGGQVFAVARLRIPLQIFGQPPSRLTPMERRMTDPTVRDVDVIAQSHTTVVAPATTETATQLSNGGAFTVISSDSTAGNDLDAAVLAAGDGSTVLLSGTFQTTGLNTVTMAFNQTLTGTATVRTASGRTAVVNTGAAINGTNVNSSTVLVRAGGTLSGLTISNTYNNGSGGRAVLVGSFATDVNILNNTITLTQSGANAGAALNFNNNSAGTVSGNTIAATGGGAATFMTALGVNSSVTVSVTNNTLSASGGTTNIMANVAGTTINAGSTGNVRGSGDCTGTPTSGSISFTNGTTCP
jgi:hypothetical protein